MMQVRSPSPLSAVLFKDVTPESVNFNLARLEIPTYKDGILTYLVSSRDVQDATFRDEKTINVLVLGRKFSDQSTDVSIPHPFYEELPDPQEILNRDVCCRYGPCPIPYPNTVEVPTPQEILDWNASNMCGSSTVPMRKHDKKYHNSRLYLVLFPISGEDTCRSYPMWLQNVNGNGYNDKIFPVSEEGSLYFPDPNVQKEKVQATSMWHGKQTSEDLEEVLSNEKGDWTQRDIDFAVLYTYGERNIIGIQMCDKILPLYDDNGEETSLAKGLKEKGFTLPVHIP